MNAAEPSDAEWAARCQLAALYRLLAHFGMTDLIYTHVSVRLPGPQDRFLINEYGRLFHQMRASDLVVVDLDGVAIDADADSRRAARVGCRAATDRQLAQRVGSMTSVRMMKPHPQ